MGGLTHISGIMPHGKLGKALVWGACVDVGSGLAIKAVLLHFIRKHEVVLLRQAKARMGCHPRRWVRAVPWADVLLLLLVLLNLLLWI